LYLNIPYRLIYISKERKLFKISSMSDSNSTSTYSTLSLDSECSEVVSPLDSIFKSCLNALSPDDNQRKNTPMSGLFKILSLMDQSSNSVNEITKKDSISSLLNSLPVPVASSSTAYSVGSEFPTSLESLTGEDLNPQKIGSSIFYDSSEKGDSLTPWNLVGRKLQSDASSDFSSISKVLGEPMSGDCLSFDSKFSLSEEKVVLPKKVVHEVYYSIASTNITICDSDQELLGESSEESPPPSSSLNSEVETEKDAENNENPSGGNKGAAAAANLTEDQTNECSTESDSAPSTKSGKSSEDNAVKLEVSGSPMEFNIPDFLEENVMNSQEEPQDENIDLCWRQLVGTNISLSPRSPALARKFSEDFSNFFY